jgi:hypothetical protein
MMGKMSSRSQHGEMAPQVPRVVSDSTTAQVAPVAAAAFKPAAKLSGVPMNNVVAYRTGAHLDGDRHAVV